MKVSEGHDRSDVRISVVTTQLDIYSLLRIFEDAFSPKLSQQVGDLGEYAHQLACLGTVLTASRNEVLAGFAVLYVNDATCGEAYMALLAVLPDSQGIGVGSRLIAESCERAAKA